MKTKLNDENFIELLEWSFNERHNKKGLKLLDLVKKYCNKKSSIQTNALTEMFEKIKIETLYSQGYRINSVTIHL